MAWNGSAKNKLRRTFLLLTLNMFLPPAKSILLIRTDFQNKHIWLYLLRLLGLPDVNGSFIKLNIIVDTSIKEDGILKFFCKTKKGQYLNGGRFLDKLWKGLKPWIKLCMLTQRHVAKVCGLCVTLHVVSQNSYWQNTLKLLKQSRMIADTLLDSLHHY